MMSPTMEEVAKEAGVGVATVDRVINKRAKVRPETAQRVLEAAEKLGFRRAGLIRHRIDERAGGYKLGFILQKRSSNFYRGMADAILAAMLEQSAPQGKAIVEFLDELTPQHVVAKLHELSRKVDAIAVVAADHPQVSQAIDQISTAGTPVFALISDLTADSRAGYVGLDQRKVGRMAAWAISRFSRAPGKVALIVGSHRYLCQEQNEISFRSYLREYAPEFQVLETLISLDDIHLAQESILELLKQHPDLAGLYVAGGGIEGVIQGLNEGEAPAGLVTICHDLTEVTRQALIEGRVDMVISHPQEWMASRLLDVMGEAIRTKGNRGAVQSVLPFTTYTAANV